MHKIGKNFSPLPEKIFGLSRKKFQAHNIIDNNNIYNISRSSESDFLKNVGEENKQVLVQGEQQNLLPKELQGEGNINQTEELTEHPRTAAISLADSIKSVMQKISPFSTNEPIISPCSNVLVAGNNKSWLPRKNLADFHPLTEEDADLLQLKSNRQFNLNFINQLLMKLAEQYPHHNFCSKKVVLNYMVKALMHELRESSKTNCGNFQFKSTDADKFKEQYLQKIERSTSTSKQTQLKRKLVGIFDPDTAYQLLISCEFRQVEQDHYQLQLLKDILLTDHMQAKILEQVQLVYGKKIKQLQIIPFMRATAQKQKAKAEDNNPTHLAELTKLNPDSVWYKVRCSLIKRHGNHIDSSIFSKLAVMQEDSINKKVILKASTAFIDYWVKQRYMRDLELAFQAENSTFELINVDKS